MRDDTEALRKWRVEKADELWAAGRFATWIEAWRYVNAGDHQAPILAMPPPSNVVDLAAFRAARHLRK